MADGIPRKHQLRLSVEMGDGAVMNIPNPACYALEGGPEWVARYGDVVGSRYTLAEIISSFDYLISPNINMTEATRRLKLLRAAYRAALSTTGGRDA